MELLGVAFALPPGHKTISRLQKGISPFVLWKTLTPFPYPIKWKEISYRPLRSCFRRHPPGYNNSKISKRPLTVSVFKTPNTLS